MLGKKLVKSKSKKPQTRIRVGAIATEKGTLAFVKSRGFEKYVSDFVFTQVYVSKRDLARAKRETALFKKFFLEHPSEQIRTIAIKKYERTMKKLGVKK